MRARALDGALCAGVLALGLTEVLGGEGYSARAVWVAGVILTASALWLRRRAPLATVVAVVAIQGALAPTEPEQDASFWFFAWLVATFSAGAYAPLRHALAGLAIVLAAFTAGAALDGERAGNVVFVWVLFSGGWSVGRLLTRRTDEAAALARRAERLEAEREVRARQAITEERARIARELHDIVAHGVSTMVLQAGGVRRVLREDQVRERDALHSVEERGRQALAEMHRMLGMMRRAEPAEELDPQPGLARLDELAQSMRVAGLPVAVHVEGEPVPLPAGLDLSAFRIVQEALTNALKHGMPARADVRVHYEPHALTIEVVDDGRPSAAASGAGHGLLGMRERVALFGGSLQTGPRPHGGYAVKACLPL